tara:strand:- start:43 stop:2736 length:2694 start_codon:yes stop_codon:yes gene_type:complete
MADNIKISALTELVSGSIVAATTIPVVDGGVTLKTQMSSIKAFTNSDVATDTELANEVSTLNNTINALTTSDISEGTNKYYTDAKVKTKLDAEGVLSGSQPAGYNLGVIAGGTSVSTVDSITLYGATVNDNGSGDIDLSINSGSLTVINGGTNITSVNTINLSGGTLTDNGGGDVTIGLGSFTVEDIAGDSISDVTKLNFDGISSLSDNGSGEVTVTIATPAATDLTSLNTFTGSIDGRVTTIEGLEIDNTSLNTFTGSFSSSVEGRVTTLETAGGGGSVDGTISGSQQITDFGFVSSSRAFDGLGLVSIISASNDPGETIQIQVTPGAGAGGDVSYEDGFHIISQSSVLPGESNIILTDVKLGTGLQDFKFIDFSESLDSRFGSGGGSDYISNVVFEPGKLTFTGNNNAFNGVVGLSAGIVSSSTQITELGFANTSDINEAYIKDRLPQNLISSSIQIINAGFVTTDSTASFALNDNITGSFTELSASLSARIGNEGSGISEARLGEVTSSMLNGGSVDGNDNVITLVSSSQQITYSGITDTPYFIGVGATITSGSDVENIPYFNVSIDNASDNTSLNLFTSSVSQSVDTLILDSGSFSERVTALVTDSGSFSERVTAAEVGSDTARFDSLEAKTGSIDTNISIINTFTSSFSSSITARITTVEGAGGGADYISNVVWSEPNLVFTGNGSGFTGNVNIASVSGSGIQEFTFTPFSASIAGRIDTIGAAAGASELADLTDVGTITNDVADGDILLWSAVEQEFTHSKDLTGDYKITGSLDTKGSMGLSGSLTVIGTVTADSFVAGDVGTPTIDSATDLDLSATNYITVTAGNQITISTPSRLQISSSYVTISDILTIEERYDTPTIGDAPTGSIIVSASVDRPKPWFWDGLDWNPLY